MTGFYKSYCPFFSKGLHIHFYPGQNVSPIILLNDLVMVTNEGSIACKYFKKKKCKKILALILRISIIFEIFQISVPIKNH